MKKHVLNVKSVTRPLQLLQKLGSITFKKINFTKKKYQPESTDESGSLSYKSRDKNKSEKKFKRI